MRVNCSGGVAILCRFLGRFVGVARCEVFYRILPSNTDYVDASDSYGGAGDTLTIPLNADIKANSNLSAKAYAIGGKQDVAVEGVFEIGIF